MLTFLLFPTLYETDPGYLKSSECLLRASLSSPSPYTQKRRGRKKAPTYKSRIVRAVARLGKDRRQSLEGSLGFIYLDTGCPEKNIKLHSLGTVRAVFVKKNRENKFCPSLELPSSFPLRRPVLKSSFFLSLGHYPARRRRLRSKRRRGIYR